MTTRRWYLFGGIAAINAMSLYTIFRIGTLVYTLPRAEGFFSVFVIVTFLFAELFIVVSAIGYYLNILAATFDYRRTIVSHAIGAAWPPVTVFIPLRNEPLEVLHPTFIACSYLDYPNLSIVVVDSSDLRGDRTRVRALALKYGLQYFQTPRPLHGAKAGALNEALKVYTTPYFVVFDCDYRPSRDFIKMLIPQMMQDSQLAYIQTPQFYGNHAKSLVSRIAQIQQSIFYEYISEGKSVHGGMFMCGTNLIIRRAALESIGWWDETTITEDYAASMDLAEKGWTSRYYNFTSAFGYGPANLEAYLKQQYRWARGTFGAFRKHFFGILNPWSRFTMWQRIEYSLSGTYFFIGVIWMILMMVPVVYIFFRISAYNSDPYLFSIVYAPYLVLSFLFYALTMRSRNYRISDLIRAQSLTFMTLPTYTRAFVDTVLNRRSEFETTSKLGDPYAVPLRILRVQYALVVINIVAVLYALWTLPDAGNKPALLTNAVWTSFHTMIILYFPITLYVSRYKNRTQGTGGTV